MSICKAIKEAQTLAAKVAAAIKRGEPDVDEIAQDLSDALAKLADLVGCK